MVLPKNLGTAEKPLLPTGMSRKYDLDKIKGRAVPIPADAIQSTPPPSEAAGDEAGAGGDTDAPADAVSETDRELITEVVDLAVRRAAGLRLGELAELIDPQQAEAGAAVIEKITALGQSVDELLRFLATSGATPGAGVGMPGAPDILGENGLPDPDKMSALIKVGDMEMTGPDSAKARVSFQEQSLDVPFVIVDDAWYIHVPFVFDDAVTMGLISGVLDKVNEKLADLVTKVKDGTIPPDQVQMAMTQMSQQLVMEMMPVFLQLRERFGGAGAADEAGTGQEESDPAEGAADDEPGAGAEEGGEAATETPPPSPDEQLGGGGVG